MARTSKYIRYNTAQPSTLVWKAGLYRRLSKEDLNKPNFNESDSIESQEYIQEDYLSTAQDIQVVDVYVDDGFTGGNEDRPEFQRMLADIDSGRINCIIVKDLSRFVRDDYAQSKYTQIIFAKGRVRFIAILDRVDSEKDPDSVHNPKTKMKAVYNENILRETSRKVTNILDMKREEGEFIGAFACYGYKKHPDNHNKLIVDCAAAQTVQLIFKMFLEGVSIQRIAIKLNQFGIPNPSLYKKLNGQKYSNPHSKYSDGLWSETSVRDILKNQIYTGDMVQGKKRKVNYKMKDFIRVPQSRWIVKEDTHEPIIDKDTFAIVQALCGRDTRTSPHEDGLSLLAGFLRCADCGRAMVKKKPSNPKSKYCYYVCRTYEKMHGEKCSRHGIRSDVIEKAVFTVLSKQIAIAVDMDKVIREINSRPKKQGAVDYISAAIRIHEKERARLEGILFDLYPDYKNGLMSQDVYLRQQKRYEAELQAVKIKLNETNRQLEKESSGIDATNGFVKNFIKFGNLQTLSREVMAALVDCIYIEENGGITIDLRFKDAYKSAAEFIGRNDAEKMQEIFDKLAKAVPANAAAAAKEA